VVEKILTLEACMISKKLFLVVILQFCLLNVFADGKYHEKYLELLQAGNFDELKLLLAEWEKAEPKNPEMFIGYFNYYVRSGAENVTEVFSDGGRQFLGSRIQYNNENVYTGIQYLDRGLAAAPDRLDMYWGKIEMLMEINDFAKAGDTLYDLIGLSPKYNKKWRLANNRSVPDGKEYFLEYINRYFTRCTDKNTEDSMNVAKRCSEREIEVYPKNTYGYNNLAIYYVYSDNTQEALKTLLRAETVNGKDCIILLNIGRLYIGLDNKDKAREYFNKVLKIGTPEEKRGAEYFLGQL
jgi:tetratricopeptide (TPR) repeat protein